MHLNGMHSLPALSDEQKEHVFSEGNPLNCKIVPMNPCQTVVKRMVFLTEINGKLHFAIGPINFLRKSEENDIFTGPIYRPQKFSGSVHFTVF